MAEDLKRAKAVRVSKRGVFTRKKNHLQQLLNGEATVVKLREVYGELAEAFKALEVAQENVLVCLEEEQMEAELAQLDPLADELSQMDLKVSTSEETHKQKELQDQASGEETANKCRWNGTLTV